MRLVFAGTPEFAVPALDALVQAGHAVAAAYTQPARPAGRGRRVEPTPVARRAAQLGLHVQTPARLDAAALAQLRAFTPEALVVVAYGLILPADALRIAPLGCYNIHASLLPRWRGAAPIQRAILAGDTRSGITIMRMDEGLDTGPIVLQQALAIPPQATAGELHDLLAPLGARLMVEALEGLQQQRLEPAAQPQAGATYAKKVGKDEARLDWTQPAEPLARAVRAFNPAPVAFGMLGEARVRILRAHAAAEPPGTPPGTILAAGPDGIRVATGSGALVITQLQWPGGKPLDARQAAAGHALGGQRFA